MLIILMILIHLNGLGQEVDPGKQLDGCVEPKMKFFQKLREKNRITIYSQPEVIGGIKEYKNKIQSSIDKTKVKTGGLVFAQITIDEKGERRRIKIIKSPSAYTSRLVKQSIKNSDQQFLPATGSKNGKTGNYKSSITIPVRVEIV